MTLLDKIKLVFRMDKIIGSVNQWRKDSLKIKTKGRARKYKHIANYARAEKLDEVKDYPEKKAKIEEESLK